MNDFLLNLPVHPNILCGAAAAFLTALIDTQIKEVGLRNYVLIVLAATLTTAAIIETWFLDSRLWLSCLLGFGVGYVADTVVLNLNATVPEFVSGSLKDVLDWMRRWLARILNKS